MFQPLSFPINNSINFNANITAVAGPLDVTICSSHTTHFLIIGSIQHFLKSWIGSNFSVFNNLCLCQMTESCTNCSNHFFLFDSSIEHLQSHANLSNLLPPHSARKTILSYSVTSWISDNNLSANTNIMSPSTNLSSWMDTIST